ncbi:protein of unknown function [Thalassobacillus cyri]|uniref:DUF4179 domain-containing protein n=1 Tax=Thalassobacillus cyri TaxID=571932 RepID=A0A1H3W9F6_9BACI|nr:DUF4179 domain-containing protein [Thalassobacillus cyri]SDZ83716.1 protein of unknown function [Thalassobacillus cyri]
MRKEPFDQQWSEIKVPDRALEQAITNGIKSGKRMKRNRKHWKSTAAISSAAASLVLASGLVFSPVTEVLAKVPVLHFIYEDMTTTVGSELFASDLVTELEEKATDNGIDITITSAYYDNQLLGITFKAEGDQLSSIKNMNQPNSSETGYGYYLFDGEEKSQWAGSMSSLKKTEDGFVGAIEFYQLNQTIDNDFTLPLTFTSVLGEKGTWKFDVPIEKRPAENLMVKGESRTEDGSYTFTMDTITKGNATTILDYETTRPKDGERDQINIDVFDDQGNRLMRRNIGNILNIKETANQVKVKERSLFTSKIDESDQFLTIHPTVVSDEFETIHAIQPSTFEVESKRFGYKIVVNEVMKKDGDVVVDYHIKNVDAAKFSNDIFNNFANQIKLIRSEDVIPGADGQTQYEALEDDSLVLAEKGTVMDREALHFQSRFNLGNQDTFTLADYSLMVPFGIFAGNDTIEMKLIKIDLR